MKPLTRTREVLGEKGRRIRELTALVQKRFGFPECLGAMSSSDRKTHDHHDLKEQLNNVE